ncbi:NAD(P)-binding protein [Acephala macrosclerotiorum]|nr:NAD(P)-binding protein [Acephala macrosclerotiorum]
MASLRKTILITGCSEGGLGAALTEVFHNKGFHVFASARTPSKIPSSLAKSPHVAALKLDVLSSESIATVKKSVSAETGDKLDVLVNNSGSEGNKLFDLNFWATLAMIRAFSPLLVKAKGCVINNAPVSGMIQLPYNSLYNASKGAMIVGSETLRLELAQPDAGQSDGRMQANGITPGDFAVKVVYEVERGTCGKVWDEMLENMIPVSARIKSEEIGKITWSDLCAMAV